MPRIIVLLTLCIGAVAQTPTVTSVLNFASSGTQLCPGVYAAVSGTGFGSNAANVTVAVGGKQGYVRFANPTSLGVQLPFEASPGATTLTVTVSGLTSAPFNVTLGSYAPALLATHSPLGPERLSMSPPPLRPALATFWGCSPSDWGQQLPLRPRVPGRPLTRPLPHRP